MELGMFTSGYQRYPLERAFSDAGRLGYDYIELWGGRPHAFAPDLRLGGVAEIRSMVEKYQMPVCVYTPEHNAYPYNYMAGGRAQWEDSMEYLELCLEMGKALGAEYTLISVGHGGYSVPRRALWARLVESLRRLADRAEALDHKILLESLTPWESNLCTTAGELAQALEEVDSPACWACAMWWPQRQRGASGKLSGSSGKKLAHLHLVDSDGHSDDHLIPGDGILPLPELLRELAERGYQGKATIELVTAYLSEPALYARRALERVRAILPAGFE
ncbi:MAG: fructoselysine 3-epimerase [Oscillospiraceae bacterium]